MNGPDPVARKIARARMELVLGHPFFGAMALRLMMREDTDCPDLWTDGVTLGYNPNVLAGRDEDEIAAMLAHVILHLACEHHLRRGDREPALWNKACDLAINGLLVESGFALPRGYPFDAAKAGKPAEAIYAALAEGLEERPGGRADQGGKRQEANTEDADGGGQGDTPLAGASRLRQAEAGQAQASPKGKKRQSASGTKDGPDRTPEGKPARGIGEVRDHPGLAGDPDESARKELTASLRQDVSQSLRAAADMGNLPARLARALGELSRPRLPWSLLLRRFILARAVSDYAWSPPNRRHIHAGLYLPSPRNQTLGDVVLAIDTSGSVGDALLAAFCAEIAAILDACDARLLLYYCDMAATGPLALTRHDPMPHLTPKGGGGTDYRPVFASIAWEGLRPACLIYLTDFECDRFPEEPDFPVLWAVPETATRLPPFGEVLKLPR